jgi:hypothetical protein
MPKPNNVTIICQNQEPYDLKIEDNGMIAFYEDCTGYGSQVLARTLVEGNVNNSNKFVIPPLA